ncbi:MAG: ABC transporter permease subunit [Chloroflexota bacterium]|nr:ABC transporter permease subunit [Chloroflexota bacterium]
MAKFILRRLGLLLLTMLIVSVAVFLIIEAAPGNIARNVLGAYITEEQEASFLAQMGLDKPVYARYFYWLAGNDWLATRKIGMPVTQITTEEGFIEWWAVEQDGSPIRWKLEGDDLVAQRRQPDGSVERVVENERWRISDPLAEAARLRTYRDTLLDNAALADADRQVILKELDRILAILDQEGQVAEPRQEALAAALAEPESALDALIEVDVSQTEATFVKAADELAKDELYQAIGVFDDLSDPAIVDAQEGDLKSMARRLGKAADILAEANPTLAATVLEASEKLDTGDITGSREALARAVPALEDISGAFVAFVDALEMSDYEQAAAVLRDMADPAKTPLDATRLVIMPQWMRNAGKQLKDVDADLGQALQDASESLQAGNTAVGRESISQAANRMAEVAHAMTVSDAARQARVIRDFWGVDTQNHGVLWEKGSGREVWQLVAGSGLVKASGGPAEYIPLQRGLLRGDPGLSLRTQRPVADTIFRRLRNSLVLAAIAFVVVMPLALVLGLIAGLNEGRPLDRILTIGGLITTVTPEFATGIFLILIFAQWLGLVPGATVFGEKAPWERPDMLVLPVLTLTLVELGYVLRITRASMVDVMKAPYIRTAFLKGLPYWRIVSQHAIRNALIAPITVIMLHVNWLLGGIVIVEVIFGYPGLGKYLLDSALFKDFNAIEAGAMILVAVAVGTQLLADIAYTFLNPRIRYE